MADTFTNFMSKLQTLQNIANSFASHTKVANWLVLDTLRAGNSSYVNGSLFKVSIGEVNQSFLTYLKNTNSTIYNYFVATPRSTGTYTYARDPGSLLMDIPHLAVSLQGVQSTTISHYDDYITWAGDVASAVHDVNYGSASANTVIGNSSYSCSGDDIRADLDAINIMDSYKSQIMNGTKTIYSVFTSYYTNGAYGNRWKSFVSHFGATTDAQFKNEINNVMDDVALVALTGNIATSQMLTNCQTVIESFCNYILARD